MYAINKRLSTSIAAVAMMFSSLTATAQEEHPAQALVQEAITEMLAYLADNIDEIRADKSLVDAKAEEVIVPHIDFVAMTQLSVGKNWRVADKTQQTELVEEFKTLLVNTYTSAMTLYSGEAIEFEPFRPESREDRAVVRTAFKQNSGSDVPVTYKLREKGKWGIYDIEVAGLSLVSNFRQKFTDEINANGIDGLLDFLRKRNNR